MAKENKSKYAILGMLSQGPMSGYAIKKAIEQSVANFWNESYGQIYPILKQLADEGLTTSHAEKQEGKPERYVYTLTKKGREELVGWLSEPIEEYPVDRNELLLKLFFGKEVSVANNIEHIQRFREVQDQRFQKYKAIEEYLKAHCADNSDLLYQLITLRFGLYRTLALISWCDETLDILHKLAKETIHGSAHSHSD
jgi:DNA-binding PadR family transcriptional regulator